MLVGLEGRKRLPALPGKEEKEEGPVSAGRNLPAEPYARAEGQPMLSRDVEATTAQHVGGGLRGDHDGLLDQNCVLVHRAGGRKGHERNPALRQRELRWS